MIKNIRKNTDFQKKIKFNSNINFIRFKNAIGVHDGNMCLTVNTLIDRNNIITGCNIITLRKVYVKPCKCDKRLIKI